MDPDTEHAVDTVQHLAYTAFNPPTTQILYRLASIYTSEYVSK